MQQPPFSYLEGCSKESLKHFRLNRQNRAAEARKALRELLLSAIFSEAEALFASWIEDYGEQLICSEEKTTSS